jgi:hypothetical protein
MGLGAVVVEDHFSARLGSDLNGDGTRSSVGVIAIARHDENAARLPDGVASLSRKRVQCLDLAGHPLIELKRSSITLQRDDQGACMALSA